MANTRTKDLLATFNRNGKRMPLLDDTGTVDGYFIADALARGLRFDNHQTALMLAAPMVLINNAMTYLELDPRHQYNKAFINGFIDAMREIDSVALNTGIKTVILPHSFEYFSHKQAKAIREHVAGYGIQEEMQLPSGVTVKFRKKPYNLDLSAFGPAYPSRTLLIPIPNRPGEYRADVKIGTLISSNSRGRASATSEVKGDWDNPVLPDGCVTPRQLAFKLDKPNDAPIGDPWGELDRSIDAHRRKDAANRAFLTGRAPA
ncbi:MAG: hypothetical protein EBQ96_03075 [Proteobacteria bacterium]|nr:hypothetical protein [Pseudomonadota bacterium]